MADFVQSKFSNKRKPTQAELLSLLEYNASTGVLRTRPYGDGRTFRRGGKKAGWLRRDGYVHVQTRLGTFYAHCLIWCMMTGSWPEHQIDHRDRDRANNKWDNLRLATASQNKANIEALNSIKAKGVEILPSGKFRARITVRHQNFHLGCFWSLEEAKYAYARAAVRYFGDFARF